MSYSLLNTELVPGSLLTGDFGQIISPLSGSFFIHLHRVISMTGLKNYD